MAGLLHQLVYEAPPIAWFLLLFSLLLVLVHYGLATRRANERRRPHNRLPPSPTALPVVGHLHHLVGSPPHVSLRRLAGRHGPDLMLLRLGALPTLVVSSPRAAELVLRTHDRVFASRPRSVVADVLLHGSRDVGFAPYGEHWRQARKLVTVHLLSARKVRSFRLALEEEVSLVMDKISEAAAESATVDMSEILRTFTTDIVCRAVSGKFFRSKGWNKLLPELVGDTTQLLGSFNAEEFFPILARAGVFRTGACAKAVRVKKRWDELLNKMIDDHMGDYNLPSNKEDDFINTLLFVKQEYGLTKEHMKAILIDIFFGAADTSSQALEYTIAELMQCPRSMKKLQAELRTFTPQGQQIVSEDNMINMTYLRAVIKEGLRLHPLTPFLTPHLSMANCTIDGYIVPAGTRALVNLWAIGRDQCYWEDAEVFMPERFVAGGSAASLSFNGNDFQFLPFGAGRRMCPGMNFGISTVETMLANLMHHFDWKLPPGIEIDMSDSMVSGLIVRRKEKLLLSPKLCV